MAHGEMIDGVWHTRLHDTKSTGGRFKRTDAEIPQLGDAGRQRRAVAAAAALRRRAGAIISTSRSPARGRTARSCSASSRASRT